MNRLGPDALVALPAAVRRPAYARDGLKTGIVHLGLGAFVRGHLAAMTDDALDAGAKPHWGITGVSLRHADTRDALQVQDGLYALALRDGAHDTLRVIGCVRECLVATETPSAVLDRIAAPDTRIVSLTITEKGYLQDPATGELQRDHADIVHDLAHADAPRSALGFIVHGLARRRSRGLGPITLVSLDNLPANGRRLRAGVLALAGRIDDDLARWIDAGCSFPGSMVDRIVPRSTDADRQAVAAALGHHDAWPVIAEPFVDWAVEDHFVAGRPDWAVGGARFVADAAPWERLKLRMVNGAHSAIAYLAVAAGWPTVDVAMAQDPLRRHVDALLRNEAGPTVGALPGLDPEAYRHRLIERFANPALAHRTLQIAMDGSQKLPQRWLDTVRDRLRAGQPIDRLALGIAAWLHYLRGRDDQGQSYAIDDPLADALQALYARAAAIDGDRQRAACLIGFVPVFGDLAAAPALVDAVTGPLRALRERGARATLASLD